MIIYPSNSSSTSALGRIGGQPIALTAAALLLILAGVASIASWRAYTGTSPETDRAMAARVLQAHTAQVSERLVEKTKGLEQTQEESIDQLQVLQDQVQTLRQLLAAQQADAKRLSEQVSSLSQAVDSLRQSFASAQPAESAPAGRNRSLRLRAHVERASQKRPKPHS
jgi:chromosome segregation ATPase